MARVGIDDVVISLAVFALVAALLYAVVIAVIKFSDARYDARSGNSRRKDFG